MTPDYQQYTQVWEEKVCQMNTWLAILTGPMENSAACTTFILPIVLLISQMMFTSLFVTSLISSLSY